ncbi:MAG: hypothetical protein EI684_04080 [Candidatus Viridilinea halotolerans]|uniref:DUF8198 domain-containing protein n=1 Tax=Candidatus Viridilinea halotolerans TaxID=2491704 RepID=A0A426U6X5_9CHLR|nr:MAG: hypothetical protein EI684_04080 [Candidatus Viridilinea halotolerans]
MTTFKQYRLALQSFQSKRLSRDYSDLAEIPQYQPVGDFFFNEMYGPHDFSERDAAARRLHQLTQVLPGVGMRDVNEVLELLELTKNLDDALAQRMLDEQTDLDFDEPTYEYCYRQLDNYDERLHQIKLVDNSIYNVFRLSRSHLLGIALHSSQIFARLLGLEAAHTFLVKGYDAVTGVHDIDQFAETVYKREIVRLKRIFDRHD